MAARELVVNVARPDGGSQRQIANPWRFSENKVTYRHTGAPLGAHTAEVLREAGFTDAEIDEIL